MERAQCLGTRSEARYLTDSMWCSKARHVAVSLQLGGLQVADSEKKNSRYIFRVFKSFAMSCALAHDDPSLRSLLHVLVPCPAFDT